MAPISKPQGNRGWILRATPPDNGLCHVFELPNAAPIILHLAAHRGSKRQQKPIARAGCDIRPAVSKWSKAVGGTVASGKIAEATPPKDAMEVEVTHSSNGEEMDTSGQATKRQTETKGASPERGPKLFVRILTHHLDSNELTVEAMVIVVTEPRRQLMLLQTAATSKRPKKMLQPSGLHYGLR